uniref:Type II and III secretion system protein n=1 Tax=Candidatus Kentrum sp. DK TaxID=2126562 RepID=A0A450TG94_9GAMM|nr:MAG: type II and III secretion system protein [Candidatus Kentron sp. DK]
MNRNTRRRSDLVVALATLSVALMLSGCASTIDDLRHTFAGDETGKGHHLTQHRQRAAEGLERLAEGDARAASQKFNEALRLKPMESDYHLLNGAAYHLDANGGNAASYELAKQGYAMAIKPNPSGWLAYYLLGRLQLERNEFAAASHNFAEALLLANAEPALLRSMAYASYRNGDLITAAAMIHRLEAVGALTTSTDYQNAALINAALGQRDAADGYFQRLIQTDQPDWRMDYIERRMDDWQGLYAKPAALQKVAWTQSGSTAIPGTFPSTIPGTFPTAIPGIFPSTIPGTFPAAIPGTIPGTSPAGAYPGAPAIGNSHKMVVVDVVMISSEELIGASKGLNLLSGLKLQFGGQQNDSAWSHSTNISDVETTTADGLLRTVTNTVTDTITKAVSIPALSYSLNIFNTTDQRNEILARPSLVALDGQRSDFFSGTELNAAAVSEGLGGQPIQIRKEIGVKLGVTPLFLDDGRLQMMIQAERTFLRTPSSDVNFTFRIETSKTTLSANVVMRFGETLILSGLSEREREVARDGIPLLQDIPIIQYGFSQRSDREFQKSMLILLTPRPIQYIYQPEQIREEYERGLTTDEKTVANLRARYSDWFKPYPNWASVFKHMQQNALYREFRTGDVGLEQWNNGEFLINRLKQTFDFLWY